MIAALLILLVAGLLQGLFVLPLNFTKNWKWEHNWFIFSLFGMVILNWLLAIILFPNVLSIYQQVPTLELMLLVLFGLLWGVGAILFGLGMDKLGLSVGYPIIMGLIAATGTMLPLILSKPESIFTPKGLTLIAGCILVVLGIYVCSKASCLKQSDTKETTTKTADFKVGIVIAILAGVLSALPNIGISFATQTIAKALDAGIAPNMASNVVWLLFFTVGFVANAIYTLYLMQKGKSFKMFTASLNGRNIFLTLLSAGCWIGSFYLYGASASSLGSFGAIVSWPLFISLAIVTGNLAGLWSGEWKSATAKSIKLLRVGMGIFLAAVIIIGLSNLL